MKSYGYNIIHLLLETANKRLNKKKILLDFFNQSLIRDFDNIVALY